MVRKKQSGWLNSGRTRQKRATRAVLLDAAVAIAAEGRSPTVAEAARNSGISRATAYRYFASNAELAIEVPLELAAPDPKELYGGPGRSTPAEAAERACTAARALTTLCRDQDVLARMAMKTSLERWLSARQKGGRTTPGARSKESPPTRLARRLDLIEAAIGYLRAPDGPLNQERYTQLATALAALMGPEAVVSLSDVARIDDKTADASIEWAITALVHAALGEADGEG